ncbi:NOL1/NOP2/sun family [Trypanosoma brucei equiperdum]|uniref:NOL1/NOP2/sun family n=1 Tax=Trypanosoma brucei equiperdum TaxID=630700 RepID=A0A3L6KV54_9TRYP|nr:NOL1/NOP2/sun family [Trypanosoma brucei equiperdum]
MDVYRQASEIVRAVREGTGTAKALCLRKEMQKKRQTYAVVCETLRHYDLLQDVLEQAEFFQYYPRANRDFAICMAYDAVLGKGVNTNRDTTAQAIQKSVSYLQEAYERVKKHHVIPPRAGELLTDEEAGPCARTGDHNNDGGRVKHNGVDGGSLGKHFVSDGEGAGDNTQGLGCLIPRYARVNTLKIDVDSLVERLRRASAKRERNNTENCKGNDHSRRDHRHRAAGIRVLPPFTLDPVVPSLLVFPPGTDLHAHPAVRSGQLVLQDRASCLPVCVLLNAVEVITSFSASGEGEGDSKPAEPLEYVVDACAAPGNKTTQLAALGAPHVKIMAIERDDKRAELLRHRVQSLGAADYTNVVNMDFLKMAQDDREVTEGILLDPSCSASGVLTRVDVALLRKQCVAVDGSGIYTNDVVRQETAEEGVSETAVGGEVGTITAEAQGVGFASNMERVMGLARLQRKLLAHSLLSFDNCRTVVYSTCSVHEAENEEVVRQVLQDERVQARGWALSNIMPTTWRTRGWRNDSDTFPLEYTIRCDPEVDATNGFFVARFDRVVATPQKRSKKKR